MTGKELNEIGLKGFTAHVFLRDDIQIVGVTLFNNNGVVHFYNSEYSMSIGDHVSIAVTEWLKAETNRSNASKVILNAENKALKATYAKLSEVSE